MVAHIAGYLHTAAAASDAGSGATPASAAAAADPDAPLFLCEGRATSAARASARVAALAAALAQRLGMQPGDRACLAALATDLNLEALLAVTAAGGIAAPLNWRWGAGEAAGAAALVGARVLLADAACLRFALALAAARPGAISTLVLLGPPGDYSQAELAAAPQGLALAFAESLMAGCPGAGLGLRAAPGGAALIVYTSGTTGAPKGVALSHDALHAQCLAKLLVCGYSAADVYLHAAPLFHIGGLCSALAMLAARARHVFLPRFDGAALLAAVRRHHVTAFIAVPAMVADLLAAAAAAGVATLPSVRRILVGGGGMPPPLQRGLAALCPAATVHTAYGMTEGASSLTFATLWGPGGASASSSGSDGGSGGGGGSAAGPPGGVFVGRPPPGIELAVYQPPADDAALAGGPTSGSGGSGSSGSIQLAGEGEVLTRGPHTMLGYWDDDDATTAAMLPGGWMRTGDLGCLRKGQLWLLGRAKDMIKSGGENVHAWEVERCLAAHPAVALAAVVGAADWRLGEAVAATVVLRPGWRWTGARCQVLLAAQPGGTGAVRSALAAAAAAVAPAAAVGSSGCSRSEEQRAAAGSNGSEAQPRWSEDLRRTLLQREAAPPRTGSPGGEGGLLADELELPPAAEEQRAEHPSAALRQLHAVAAGLQHAADSSSGDAGGSSSAAAGGAGGVGSLVDGPALQQHCRAAGLAGFKLPRVFLCCDAAGGAGFPPAAGSTGSGAAVLLPTNSTGKVVKHLLREAVQAHMAAARAGGGGSGSGLRSRM